MQYDISKYISQKEFNNKCRGNFDLPIDTPIIIRKLPDSTHQYDNIDRYGYDNLADKLAKIEATTPNRKEVWHKAYLMIKSA